MHAHRSACESSVVRNLTATRDSSGISDIRMNHFQHPVVEVRPETFDQLTFSPANKGTARAVASLNHPHISVLHDIGNQDGTGYMVTRNDVRPASVVQRLYVNWPHFSYLVKG